MKRLFSLSLAIAFACLLNAGEEATIVTIDNKEFKSDEFLRIYNKNNNLPGDSEKKSIDEYLDLFVNYKLKVIEAENQGYDTASSFKQEFTKYQKQLAKPYLENKELTEELIKESFERYQYEVNASHILIQIKNSSSAQDTLDAWNKIKSIQARLAAGEPFGEIAAAESDDPSAKSNNGDLGWFGAFRMVYPFESAAFSTPVGEISAPVKTRFGYHLVKVNDKRPNRGEVRPAHIFVQIPQGASDFELEAAQNKINKAYNELQNDGDWNDIVMNYSEHEATKSNGGDFGWMSTGSVVEQFLDSCFAIENGTFSEPFRTQYGFHIVKTLDKRGAKSFTEVEEELKNKINRDSDRKEHLNALTQNDLEQKYGVGKFQENVDELKKYVSDEAHDGAWNADTVQQLNKPVLKIGKTQFSQYDFAKFLATKEPASKEITINDFVNTEFDAFIKQEVFNYQEAQLVVEYPDYAHLVQEYYDGILLFNISNDLVWEKATKDSTGLEAFYKNLDTKYEWKQRLYVTKYSYSDSGLTQKILPIAKKQAKKKMTKYDVMELVCPEDTLKSCLSNLREYKIEAGDKAWADSLTWKKGSYLETVDGDNTVLYYVNAILKPGYKTLKDARGIYIADYQTYLEKQWIAELREKYTIEVNQEALTKLKEKEQN